MVATIRRIINKCIEINPSFTKKRMKQQSFDTLDKAMELFIEVNKQFIKENSKPEADLILKVTHREYFIEDFTPEDVTIEKGSWDALKERFDAGGVPKVEIIHEYISDDVYFRKKYEAETDFEFRDENLIKVKHFANNTFNSSIVLFVFYSFQYGRIMQVGSGTLYKS